MNGDFDHLFEVVFVRFSTLKLLFLPPSYPEFFGRRLVGAAYTQEWRVMLPPPRGQSIYINYLEFLCIGNLPLLPHLLINHLFI